MSAGPAAAPSPAAAAGPATAARSADSVACPGASPRATAFDELLGSYRDLVLDSLLAEMPRQAPAYLYDLLPVYPSRPGKGLRAALCLAVCRALGGSLDAALDSAVALELFHNGFLIHDDAQDGSEARRGEPTLHAVYGHGVAFNVGNATHLLALRRLMANRRRLGPEVAWRVCEETELMLRHTLEGQAIELGWIRDVALDLGEDDYYRLCLKKTSWYTTIYPCRVGAAIATRGQAERRRFDRFGWYLGAAFQIRDDLLNLEGDYSEYGKEIGGDLLEGKRTLMLIHLLGCARGAERRRLARFLSMPRAERAAEEATWVLSRMVSAGSLEVARRAAWRLARAALHEARSALADVPDSPDRRFVLALPRFVVRRRR